MTETITILAVDDEPNNLRALKLDLENTGYHVLTAGDGAQAWEILQQHKDDIKTILLDRMMPNMNGMEFMDSIKKDKTVSSIPVIMQTAAAEKEQMVEGIKAGVYYYLTKPYDIDVMLSIVFSAVNDYRNNIRLRNQIKKFTRKLNLVREARFEARTLDDVQYLVTFLAQFFPAPENVALGISELLTNAVEHGNLGIGYDEKTNLNKAGKWQAEIERRLALPENASKFVTITYRFEARHITLCIKDQGHGFNWNDYLEISPERAMDNHGRGIALSRMMSFDHMEYVGNGNQVICRVNMDASLTSS